MSPPKGKLKLAIADLFFYGQMARGKNMSGQIFISYRREESRWSARSLHDRLCRDFDPKQIFMDIDAIALGEDFVEAIETTVAKCDVLIAVIGNNWPTSKDENGHTRLNNPEDFVRMEIGAALKRKIRVIPVLVDGASMPRARDLPEELTAASKGPAECQSSCLRELVSPSVSRTEHAVQDARGYRRRTS